MELLIASFLVGVFFGVYCNFLILVPLTLATIIACGAAAASHGQTISGVLLAILIPAVALQGGYMIGLTSRDLLSQLLSRLHLVPSKRI
ncbi:hypothetical protein [Bradyrhizobium australiense]|uniref:Uncharacterized protein n=1 Tax=Bradyrhizobium australiense TaxID=2721161 RepID=A0A7Y4LYV8_9BRAD|nr:hypothetical protein [Bradyrhizobium australiense]NOJ43666.1 hypothetical protein [Bradyrhizobium australiense]